MAKDYKCKSCRIKCRCMAGGLCKTCYNRVEVREFYMAEANRVMYARCGVGGLNRARSMGEPTDARPGTEAKIVVLERRAEAGEVLFHPMDARHLS